MVCTEMANAMVCGGLKMGGMKGLIVLVVKGLRGGDDDEFNGGSLRVECSCQSLGSCIMGQSSDTNTVCLNYLKPRLNGRREEGELVQLL